MLLLPLGRCLCWWTVSPLGYHQPSSPYLGTGMKIRIFLCYWNLLLQNVRNYHKLRNASPSCKALIPFTDLAILFWTFRIIALHLLYKLWISNILATSTTEETCIVEMRIWCRKIGTVNVITKHDMNITWIAKFTVKETTPFLLESNQT